MSSNTKYTLVAWTDGGQFRMVPSLVNEAARPYKERIETLEAEWEDVRDEVGWLLARSRAHEAFARFLLSVGYPRDAYTEFSNAAMVCAFCSDDLLVQGDSCDFPVLPLLRRFYSMHRECVRLVQEDPFLRNIYRDSTLRRHYLTFTQDDRQMEEEVDESFESMKAWRFGKVS